MRKPSAREFVDIACYVCYVCCSRGIDVKYFPLGRDWYNRLNALTLFPVPDIAYD
jgi:hypothetical protein